MSFAKAMRCEEKSQRCAAEPVGNELEEALSVQSESALLQQPRPCFVNPFSSRELTRMCKEVSSAVHAKPNTAMQEGPPHADRHRTDVTVRAKHESTTWHVVKETVLNGSFVLKSRC